MVNEEQKESAGSSGNPEGQKLEQESFADLLEKSGGFTERLSPGQKVKARVVSISDDVVYIDLGGKSEGIVDRSEMVNEKGAVDITTGDEIEAYFVGIENGVRKLTTLVHGYPASKMKAVRDAFKAGLPVTGEVRREVKGGFEVSAGGVRCFCPFSHIDLKGGREGGIYLGRSFPFQVLEFENDGKNIILSRRILLEQEQEARIDVLKSSLDVGSEVVGRVRSIQKFGVFVDLGGIDALIPSSELSWDRSVSASDICVEGKEVRAKVISVDWDSNRVTLSIKALTPDPWSQVEEKYPVDSRVEGTISRLAPFGAFVTLESGVDGLIHISNLGAGRRINHPKEVVQQGQLVETYVLAVDRENRKISLSMQPRVEPKKIVLPEPGELVSGVVDKVMPFGVFLKLENGLSGLVPNAEIGETESSDYKRLFPSGKEMQAIVTDVDPSNNKIRLSRKALMEKKTEDEYREYVQSLKQANESSGFGSLGDILKAKLAEKKQNG